MASAIDKKQRTPTASDYERGLVKTMRVDGYNTSNVLALVGSACAVLLIVFIAVSITALAVATHADANVKRISKTLTSSLEGVVESMQLAITSGEEDLRSTMQESVATVTSALASVQEQLQAGLAQEEVPYGVLASAVTSLQTLVIDLATAVGSCECANSSATLPPSNVTTTEWIVV